MARPTTLPEPWRSLAVKLGGVQALTVLESKLKTEFDRMALDHLFGIGAIREGSPTKSRATKKGRIAWKRLLPTNRLGCDQCGMGGAYSNPSHPYNMSLCSTCESVHIYSLSKGLKPSDDVWW